MKPSTPVIARPTTADRLAGMDVLRRILRLPEDADETARLTYVLEMQGFLIARVPADEVMP